MPRHRLWRTEGRLCHSQKQPSLCGGGKWAPCVGTVWARPVVIVYLAGDHTRTLVSPIHYPVPGISSSEGLISDYALVR